MSRSTYSNLQRNCYWNTGKGWAPRAPMTHAQAQEAVMRIFMLTRRYYLAYKCRKCRYWHIRKLGRVRSEALRANGAGPC